MRAGDVLTEEERQALIELANATAAVHAVDVAEVYHFSEDGTLGEFVPHVPVTNPSQPPAVWAIDAEHSPLYWFPRDCPRISIWARDADQRSRLADRFGTEAERICAFETRWYERVRSARLYRYTFDAGAFRPWSAADGQYVTDETVRATAVERLDDLLGLHAAAGIELRMTPVLGPFLDQVLLAGLPFSCVRLRNARR
jgi:hypothetical protein